MSLQDQNAALAEMMLRWKVPAFAAGGLECHSEQTVKQTLKLGTRLDFGISERKDDSEHGRYCLMWRRAILQWTMPRSQGTCDR